MRILHFNSQKYEDYIHECPPPHAEWSILTVINRAGYIKMKFSYSNHLAHAVRRAKVPVVKRDLFVSPGGYLEKQCEAAFWKCIERERLRWVCYVWSSGICRMQAANSQEKSADSAEMNHMAMDCFWGANVAGFLLSNKILNTFLKMSCRQRASFPAVLPHFNMW